MVLQQEISYYNFIMVLEWVDGRSNRTALTDARCGLSPRGPFAPSTFPGESWLCKVTTPGSPGEAEPACLTLNLDWVGWYGAKPRPHRWLIRQRAWDPMWTTEKREQISWGLLRKLLLALGKCVGGNPLLPPLNVARVRGQVEDCDSHLESNQPEDEASREVGSTRRQAGTRVLSSARWADARDKNQ